MDNTNMCNCGSRLCPGALGVAFGITFAVLMVIFGLLAWHFHIGSQWVAMASSVYVGFALTAKGIAVGAIWAFVEGIFVGAMIAFVYNCVSKCCKCKCCRSKNVANGMQKQF